MSGLGVAFALTFDHPVDHHGSQLILVLPGGGTRTLFPRLRTQPNTLYASVGKLDPGDYELRYNAKPVGGEMLTGTIPFTIRGQ